LTVFVRHFGFTSAKAYFLQNYVKNIYENTVYIYTMKISEVYGMIVTTTPSVEGRRIKEYRGLVFGEVVSGVNFIKDFAAGLSNFFGGRSGSYEGELIDARDQAVMEMIRRAEQTGANAVVGVDVDYEVLGQGNMLMVTASGTAVVLE